MFRQKTEPSPIPNGPVRTAAIVREELEVAKGSLQPLAEKSSIAQAELSDAQLDFDSAMRRFALGEIGKEPDRGVLQVSVSRADALHRVKNAQENAVRRLTAELAETELREASQEEIARLPVLTGYAESKLAVYAECLGALQKAEGELYAALFSGEGLKQHFTNPDIEREATRARGSIRARAVRFAEQFKYSIAANFLTDGLDNLGAKAYPLEFLFRFFRTQ